MRKIIHIDMDAFYASVEQRDRPELKGLPVVVGGSPSGRGVVASASYEARRFGIRSAMSARNALKLCPATIFVTPQFSKYKEVSRQIRAIFFDVTDLVEPLSLDEAYLDVTTNKFAQGSATRLAELIRARIQNELGLTASAGVAPNKFLAKVASDLRKPNGIFVITPAEVPRFVEKLPVEKLWGVGPATAKKMQGMGLLTTADLRKLTAEDLVRRLGSFGRFLHGLSFGLDSRPVQSDRQPKSRGSETTFEKDTADIKTLTEVLEELSGEVSQALTRIAHRGLTVTLKIRYHDFTTLTRSRTLATPTALASVITQVALALLITTRQARLRPVRLLGISMGNLVDENYPEQLMLKIE